MCFCETWKKQIFFSRRSTLISNDPPLAMCSGKTVFFFVADLLIMHDVGCFYHISPRVVNYHVINVTSLPRPAPPSVCNVALKFVLQFYASPFGVNLGCKLHFARKWRFQPTNQPPGSILKLIIYRARVEGRTAQKTNIKVACDLSVEWSTIANTSKCH